MDPFLLKVVVLFAPGAHFANESHPNHLRHFILHVFGAVDTGISTKIYGYQLRLDYASGIEDQKIKSGVFHLGIGSKF